MNSRSIVGALSLVLAAGWFVAGCSSVPTAPPPSAPEGSSSGSGSVPAPAPQAVSRSVYVRAALGGTVSSGNFRVIVPPGALEGDAIVTVKQPDRTKPEVELTVTPEDRNGFRLPVLLVADVAPMDDALVTTSYLSWWNPDGARWERCEHSLVNALDVTVQAPLLHFSRYRVEQGGKAGW